MFEDIWPKKPAKTDEVFEFLKKCAEEMRTVSYEELAKTVGLANPGVGQPLGYVRDRICRERGLPWLNAIAVQKHSRRPGESFLPEGVSVGMDEERMWRGMVLQVFAFDWRPVSP
jgi:hypothetical protein